MTRLQSELDRLYLARPSAHSAAAALPSPLIDPSGRVRALVLAVTLPLSWKALSKAWLGVQTELDLPAPAIAVDGTDGFQLWFSLAEPIEASDAHAFLDSLRVRFLPDADPRRVRLLPAADAVAAQPAGHAQCVPALQAATGNWSAFVAADLAPIFEDTPWLDIPPSEEGQATLLHGLVSITPAALDEALRRLGPRRPAVPLAPLALVPAVPVAPAGAELPPVASTACDDAERFLHRIVNDESVSLALRIEAAKALLLRPAVSPRPPPAG